DGEQFLGRVRLRWDVEAELVQAGARDLDIPVDLLDQTMALERAEIGAEGAAPGGVAGQRAQLCARDLQWVVAREYVEHAAFAGAELGGHRVGVAVGWGDHRGRRDAGRWGNCARRRGLDGRRRGHSGERGGEILGGGDQLRADLRQGADELLKPRELLVPD